MKNFLGKRAIELTYLEGIKKKQEPLVESALLKIKQGKNITKEEEEVLWYRKYINYSIQRRGVAFRAEAFTGIKENTKNNLMAIASVAISDYAIDKALLAFRYSNRRIKYYCPSWF